MAVGEKVIPSEKSFGWVASAGWKGLAMSASPYKFATWEAGKAAMLSNAPKAVLGVPDVVEAWEKREEHAALVLLTELTQEATILPSVLRVI